MPTAIVYVDGASLGNPGPAGCSAVIFSDKNCFIAECYESIESATSNVAEYMALLLGLKKCIELGLKNIEVRSDSELLVNQMQGKYRIRNKTIAQLFLEAKKLTAEFDKIVIRKIPRSENKYADSLSVAAASSIKK